MKKRSWETIALAALVITVLASHSLYVYKTYQFPQWDENVYLQYAVNFLPILKNPTWNFWSDILEVVKYRQPFYPFFISLPLLLLGTEYAYKIALLLNGIFYATTIVFTYLLSREFLSKVPSFLASYMFAFYGFPLFYIHFAHQETAATSLTVMALFFLVKICKSSSLKNTFFFSLFAAIGVLVRWIVPLFLLGPFLITLFKFVKIKLRKKKFDLKPFLKHIALFIVVGIIPTLLLYYLPNLSLFLDYTEGNRVSGPQWAPDPIKNSFSRSSLIWYASVLAQQTIFFWLLFIAGFLIAVTRFKKYAFLVLTVVIPYLFLTLGSTWKDDRFIVPLYPTMAIISAIVIEWVKHIKVRSALILTILVLGFLNFLGASWGIGPMKFSVHGDSFTVPHSILIPMPIGHPRRVWLAPISWPPRPNEGNVPLILKTIKKDFPYEKGDKPNLLFTFDFSQISEPLAVDATIEDPKALSFNQLYSTDTSYKLLFQKIHGADYLLVKTGRLYDEPRRGQDVIRMIELFNEALHTNGSVLPKAFEALSKIPIPIDNSTLTIYKRTRAISNEEWLLLAGTFAEIDPSSSSEIFKAVEEFQRTR